MRRLLAGLALAASVAGAAQAQTTLSGPVTFGTAFTVSGGGTVSIAGAGIANAMLANPGLTLGATALTLGTTTTSVAGLTLSGATLAGATALPGGGTITGAGWIGIEATPVLAPLQIADPGVTQAVFGSTTSGVSLQADWPAIGFNSYYSSGFKAIAGGYAAQIEASMVDGSLQFLTAPSVGAGAAQAMTERLRITNAGFVGLGTMTPNYPMQIEGGASNDAVVQFTNAATGGGAGAGGYVGFLSGGTDLWIDNQAAGAVKLLAGGVEQLRVDSGGGFYLDNLPTTPGGKQPLCIDTSSKQVYDGSAGSC